MRRRGSFGLSRWVVAALMFEAAAVGLDVGLGRDAPLTGAFVIAPLALAAVEGPATVGAVAALSVVLALLSGVWNDYLFSSQHIVRVGFVLGAGVVAVAVSRGRLSATSRREELQALSGELRSTERRLEAILSALGEAVTVRSAAGPTVYANDAARRLIGLESQDEIESRSVGGVAADFIMEDEHGRTLSMDDLPSTRVLRSEPAPPMLIRSVRRATGDERWIMVKSTPLVDDDGAVAAAVNVLEDVTAVKRSELRTRFLAEAAVVLASSLDLEQTLRNVAGLAVPRIADWCAVDMIDEDGDRVPVAVAHHDPARVALAERLREYEPNELDPNVGIGLVVRTGKAALYPSITEEMLTAGAVDDEHLALLRKVGFRSALIAPLKIGVRVVGVLTMVTAESGRALDEGDVEFAEQLADRAAVAVENSRLYSQRNEVARTLQESLLPAALPHIPGWETAVLYLPAGHGTEVGGDFYDLWPVEEGWLAVVGDVTGKGIQAAALTSLVRHTARTASEFAPDPAAVLAHVDRTLQRERELSLCTALCAKVAGDRLTVSCGGHPLPILLHQGEAREVGRYSPLLGAFPDGRWAETVCDLCPGDTLVAYTDGVTDAVGADGRRFGSERLMEVLGSAGGGSPADVLGRLRRALTDFQVGAQADDTAVLVLRYVGVREPAAARPRGDQVPGLS